MGFELGAFCPNPGGTGHFLGEGGVEAAARRGLERQKREREEAERARKAAADDTISQTTTIVDDAEKDEKKEESSQRRSIIDVKEKESPSSEFSKGSSSNHDSGHLEDRKRSPWRYVKDKISGTREGS